MLILMSSGLLCCQVNVCFTWLKGGVPPVLEFLKVFNCTNMVTGGKFLRLFFLTHSPSCNLTANLTNWKAQKKGVSGG